MKASTGAKIKTKWEKQNNSNKCLGSGCIQICSRNTAVEREWIERCGQEIRENNDNIWALHPRRDVERLYIKRKEWDRVLISVECCVREEVNSLDFYVFNSEETLIRRVAAAETINTEDTGTSRELKKKKAQELKENWH